jgi:hypothetical protein
MKQTVTKKLSERDIERGEVYQMLQTRTVHTRYLEVKSGSGKETLQKNNLLHLKLWSEEVTRDKRVRKCTQRVHNAGTLDLLLSVYFSVRSFWRKTMYLSTFDTTHTTISLRILATDIQSIIIDVMETATCLSCSICIDSYLYNGTVSSPATRTLQRTDPVSITRASNIECCYVYLHDKCLTLVRS